MFILEIILTVAAWKRGWRWLALLPGGIVACLGLITGFVTGLTGGELNMSLLISFDILGIFVMGIMAAVSPDKVKVCPSNGGQEQLASGTVNS
jgi:cation transport ATPase